jgi:hypothetical protein
VVRSSGLTGIAASLFSANFYLYSLPQDYFDVSQQLNPLLHTWTLGVEEQFYLLFPAVLLATWWLGVRTGKARLAATFAILALGASSLVFANALLKGVHGFRSPDSFAFYASPARAWEFAAGAVAALAAPALRRLPPIVASALAAAGATAVALAALVSLNATITAIYVIPVAGAVALVAAGTIAETNLVSGLLARAPMVWVGNLSYSWYLWHWPLIVFARALFPAALKPSVAAAGVSLLPAWLSYRYVENPIRFNAAISGRRAVRIAAVCIAVPIVASCTLIGVQRWLPAATTGGHLDSTAGCDSDAPYGSPSRAHCIWRVPDAKGEVVLIGDSNAGQYSEPVVVAAHRAHLNATVIVAHGCPFIQPPANNGYEPSCRVWSQRSLATLLRRRPQLVIIAARTDAYLDGRLFVDPVTGKGTSQVLSPIGDRPRLWEIGLRRELEALNRAGSPVILVLPIPEVPVDAKSCANVLLILGRCHGSLRRDRVDKQLASSVNAERAAAAGLALTTAVDLEDQLCTSTRCSNRAPNGELIYRDGSHLSVAGALRLTTTFATLVAAHARRSS